MHKPLFSFSNKRIKTQVRNSTWGHQLVFSFVRCAQFSFNLFLCTIKYNSYRELESIPVYIPYSVVYFDLCVTPGQDKWRIFTGMFQWPCGGDWSDGMGPEPHGVRVDPSPAQLPSPLRHRYRHCSCQRRRGPPRSRWRPLAINNRKRRSHALTDLTPSTRCQHANKHFSKKHRRSTFLPIAYIFTISHIVHTNCVFRTRVTYLK